jgi:membrane protease YdiL (CAAX protease family)
MARKDLTVKHAAVFSTYLFLVWGAYRFLSPFSEATDELIAKPVLWLLPIVYLLKKEKSKITSLGLGTERLFFSIYLSFALGVGFATEGILVHILKYGGIHFASNVGGYSIWVGFFLSFVTAFVEEITFRGYLFTRLLKAEGDEWKANLVTSFLWTMVHAPIAIFVLNLNLANSFLYLILVGIFGIGSAFVFARTKNLASSIILHLLWSWPIILFR